MRHVFLTEGVSDKARAFVIPDEVDVEDPSEVAEWLICIGHGVHADGGMVCALNAEYVLTGSWSGVKPPEEKDEESVEYTFILGRLLEHEDHIDDFTKMTESELVTSADAFYFQRTGKPELFGYALNALEHIIVLLHEPARRLSYEGALLDRDIPKLARDYMNLRTE